MEIRIKTPVCANGKPLVRGQVYDLERIDASRLIRAGQAELCLPSEIETTEPQDDQKQAPKPAIKKKAR